MKRSVIFILLFFLLIPYSEAQLWKMKKFEFTLGAGPSMFFGDIGGFSRDKNLIGFRDMSISQTRFDLNLNLKYRITQKINARVSLTYGLLHASDQRGSNEERGFEASISIIEPALIGEYYFIKNRAESSYLFSKGRVEGSDRVGLLRSLDFYLFAGIGGIKYFVSGNDKLVDYGMKTSGYASVIPVGLGTTLVYSPNINFGVEFGGRYAFSDNLDGYSSQYSNSNDVYYFFNLTITVKMKTGANGLPSLR
jgi:hypothetical protein